MKVCLHGSCNECICILCWFLCADIIGLVSCILVETTISYSYLQVYMIASTHRRKAREISSLGLECVA